MRILIFLSLAALAAPSQTPADERAEDAFEKVMAFMKPSPDGKTLDEAAAKAQAQRFQNELGAFIARWQPRAAELSEGRLVLGRALTLSGRPAEAIPHFKHFVAKHPKSPDAQQATISLGTAYLDSRDWANAGAVLSGFLAAHPKSDRRVVAEYYLGVGRPPPGPRGDLPTRERRRQRRRITPGRRRQLEGHRVPA